MAKIIWGHPGIGKTHLRKSSNEVIDFDSDYKSLINLKYNLPKGFKARNEWRESNGKLWKQEVLILWRLAVNSAKHLGRTLMVSDMLILRECSDDLDLVVTMSKDLFIERAKLRNDYNEGSTESWKTNLDDVIGKTTVKTIVTDKFMVDVLSEIN